jgi:cytochrome c-type biogenesis protein CcmH/NrfG
MAYQKQGRHGDAIKAFERATQIMPSSRHPWEHLSQEYLAVGRAADAQRAAGRAQQLPAGNSGKKKA